MTASGFRPEDPVVTVRWESDKAATKAGRPLPEPNRGGASMSHESRNPSTTVTAVIVAAIVVNSVVGAVLASTGGETTGVEAAVIGAVCLAALAAMVAVLLWARRRYRQIEATWR